jgi:hypothetical protein
VPAIYSFNATVTDLLGDSNSSANLNINVVPPPSITLSPASSAINKGQSIKFTNLTSNGIAPYAYSYNVPTGVQRNGNSFTFNVIGNYVITETVTDTNGFSASASAQVSVGVPLSPYAKVSVNGNKFDVGQTVPITGSVSNLAGPYTYSLMILGVPYNRLVYSKSFSAISTNSYLMSYKTTLPGLFYAKVSVTSTSGSATSQNSNRFIVYPAFSIFPIRPDGSKVNQGQSDTLYAGAFGGSWMYSYQWYVKAPGSSSFVAIPGATKSYYVFTTNSLTQKGSIYQFAFNAIDVGITTPIALSDQPASVTISNTVQSGKNPCSGGSGDGKKGSGSKGDDDNGHGGDGGW